MGYSVERRESVLRKMLSPSNASIAQLAREEGISDATLYLWRRQARDEGRLMPDSDNTPQGWTSRDKFAAVMETAPMNEAEVAAYCRERGLYPEQLKQWRQACEQANDWNHASEAAAEDSHEVGSEEAAPAGEGACPKGKGSGGGGSVAGAAKKVRCDVRGSRGRMIPLEHRQQTVDLIKQAVVAGARLRQACVTVEIDPGTYRRWQPDGAVVADQRPNARRPMPKSKLTPEEKQAILEVCHSPTFQSSPPSQIVPALADQGVYLASESSIYRVLHEQGEQHDRGRARCREKRAKPAEQITTGSNQCWCWDVTWLRTAVRGMFYYLYLIEDVFSRKVVGWEVHETESGELASSLVQRAVMAEGFPTQLSVLHADNGSIQKSATLRATLDRLGIEPSYSRPRTSNDNAYPEALFRTTKVSS